MGTINKRTLLRPLLDEYVGVYHTLLEAGVKLRRQDIGEEELLGNYLPGEKEEMLLEKINQVVARMEKELSGMDERQTQLIQTGKVNIAGFADFTWHEAFEKEMHRFANQKGIDMNFQFFLKSNKKQFQTYLNRATDVSQLPDILVGKGFSSLMTRRFIDTFIASGDFDCPLEINVHEKWKTIGLYDDTEQYHAFGAEELVILHDESIATTAPVPCKWSDLLRPEYKHTITQMGKPQRDHFGFNSLFYLHQAGGEEAIRAFAGNVKHKWHFSRIIKDIGKNHPEASAYNIVQRYATLFVRSDAKAKVLEMEDGNPVSTFFCLVKKGSSEDVKAIARHLFSKEIAAIIEFAGAVSAHPDSAKTTAAHLRWIGWDTITMSTLPYLKEELSDIAFQEFGE